MIYFFCWLSFAISAIIVRRPFTLFPTPVSLGIRTSLVISIAFFTLPFYQAMMQANPEVAQMFNDPALLRQSLEMARNPRLMNEMMRSSDRQLSNIESHPEGFNALRRCGFRF